MDANGKGTEGQGARGSNDEKGLVREKKGEKGKGTTGHCPGL